MMTKELQSSEKLIKDDQRLDMKDDLPAVDSSLVSKLDTAIIGSY